MSKDFDKNIEAMLGEHYGKKPAKDHAAVDRIVAHVTQQPQDSTFNTPANDTGFSWRRMAAMACLVLSVVAGTLTGYNSAGLNDYSEAAREEIVFNQVEAVLFATSFSELGG